MEVSGSDIKRPRLSYDGPPRMQSQHPPPPISPAHANNQSILPAPATYPGPLGQHGPPPSPFHDAPHDVRVPVEPSVHSFVQHHSGHTTPRDGRFPHEVNYSRRGSASGTPRSPDDHHFPPPPRSMSVSTNDPASYPSQYATEAGSHLIGYQAPDQHMNGNIHHGLSIHTHPNEAGPGMGAMSYEYGQPMHPNAHPYAGAYGSQMQGQAQLRAKKGNRAQQACDSCRTRKAKCDEGRPNCGYCVENGLTCNYQNVAPAKIDRTNQMLMDHLSATQQKVEALTDLVDSRLRHIERAIFGGKDASSKDSDHSITPKDDSEVKPTARQLQSSPPLRNASGQLVVAPNQSQASPGKKESKIVDVSPGSSLNTNGTEGSGNDVPPAVTKQNTIAAEHNTAAQKLFRWPAIKRLLEKSKLKESEKDENYVMTMELHKGPLRMYGRGQGSEPGESSYRVNMGPASPAPSSSSGPSDESVEGRSPASMSENMWGFGINPHVGEPRPESAMGGLHANNTLKLDSRTIDTLFQNYLRHLHVLHPFLDEQQLTTTIGKFKHRYNPPDMASSHRDGSAGYNIPAKRKAPDGQFWVVGPEPLSGPSVLKADHPLLERSPTTAMVLLILALGKICEHREALPGPVPSSLRDFSAYPGRPSSPLTNAHFAQSPPDSASMRHSPSSSGQSVANPTAASPLGLLRQNHRSPRSSVGDSPVQNRNLDVIPGLAYYAQATDILGNLTGSTNLTYSQCCILAGLYAGQLANSFESLSWMQNAARAICIMLNSDPSSHPDRIEGKSWRNSLRFAFHTTSQLENDILAEIDLPRAGLHLIETCPYPDGYVTTDTLPHNHLQQSSYGEIMQFYSSQLHIRGILNQAQHTIYANDKGAKSSLQSSLHRPTRDVLDDFINDLRCRLPPALKWDDVDMPSMEINHARLRGKWYGAQYIIHRPYLHYALDLDENGGLDEYMFRKYGTPRPQPMGNMAPPPTTVADDLMDTILNSAKTCIAAAQRSTTAFDGILDHRRLIVTNIFGTAHAQFGNMLVLSAVYCSKHLKRFISEDPTSKMDFLFRRTIAMLKRLKPVSATLGHDAYILECLREVILRDEDSIPATSSFSSA